MGTRVRRGPGTRFLCDPTTLSLPRVRFFPYCGSHLIDSERLLGRWGKNGPRTQGAIAPRGPEPHPVKHPYIVTHLLPNIQMAHLGGGFGGADSQNLGSHPNQSANQPPRCDFLKPEPPAWSGLKRVPRQRALELWGPWLPPTRD